MNIAACLIKIKEMTIWLYVIVWRYIYTLILLLYLLFVQALCFLDTPWPKFTPEFFFKESFESLKYL